MRTVDPLVLPARASGRRRSRDPEALLTYVQRNGGLADRRSLLRHYTPGALDAVLADRRLITYGRSRLASPVAAQDVRAAHRYGGVLARRSAAAWWGWELLAAPDLPEIAVPRGARLPPIKRGCDAQRVRLKEGEVLDGATAPLRTVLDCAATLPLPDALAVADSALRHGDVTADELRSAADAAGGRGAAAKRRVAHAADGGAANPFESAVRAVLHDVPGLDLRTQYRIRGEAFEGGTDFEARVDLADPHLRLVVEADSFEYHGGTQGLSADAERYCELVARGWTVLRCTWAHAIARPEWVRALAAATVERLAEAAGPRRGSGFPALAS